MQYSFNHIRFRTGFPLRKYKRNKRIEQTCEFYSDFTFNWTGDVAMLNCNVIEKRKEILIYRKNLLELMCCSWIEMDCIAFAVIIAIFMHLLLLNYWLRFGMHLIFIEILLSKLMWHDLISSQKGNVREKKWKFLYFHSNAWETHTHSNSINVWKISNYNFML